MSDKGKVLIVDDDPQVRRMYELAFESAGYEVDVAGDGDEGTKLALIGGYKAMLLDVMLPQKDGLSILTCLKEGECLKKNGPIVMMTSLTQDSVVENAESLGAKMCMEKLEYEPNEVVLKVEQLINEEIGGGQ